MKTKKLTTEKEPVFFGNKTADKVCNLIVILAALYFTFQIFRIIGVSTGIIPVVDKSFIII